MNQLAGFLYCLFNLSFVEKMLFLLRLCLKSNTSKFLISPSLFLCTNQWIILRYSMWNNLMEIKCLQHAPNVRHKVLRTIR